MKATNDPDYADSQLSANVSAGYHAMALDERRKLFPRTPLEPRPRVQQAWFAGTHSDVGGGYPDTGLADATLKWMIVKAARNHGLRFDPEYTRAHIHPDPLAPLHESADGFWSTFGILPRPVATDDPVHESVRERLASNDCDYQPANLPHEPRFET